MSLYKRKGKANIFHVAFSLKKKKINSRYIAAHFFFCFSFPSVKWGENLFEKRWQAFYTIRTCHCSQSQAKFVFQTSDSCGYQI